MSHRVLNNRYSSRPTGIATGIFVAIFVDQIPVPVDSGSVREIGKFRSSVSKNAPALSVTHERSLHAPWENSVRVVTEFIYGSSRALICAITPARNYIYLIRMRFKIPDRPNNCPSVRARWSDTGIPRYFSFCLVLFECTYF